MPASGKASSACSPSSLLPLLPYYSPCSTSLLSPLWLPQGLLPRPATCQSKNPASPERRTRVRVGTYKESTADVSKHREEMCLATPLMKTATAASTIAWHGDKHNLKAKQCNTVPGKCSVPGMEGKHATTCVSHKEKPWRNIMEVAISQATRAYPWL